MLWFGSLIILSLFVRLVGNPICDQGINKPYCTPTGQSNPNPAQQPYTTAQNCSDKLLSTTCLPSQDLSPSCICAVPYKGTLFLRAPPFSDTSNASYKYFTALEIDMKDKFIALEIPVDSISIHDLLIGPLNNMEMSLEVFPSGKLQFSESDISKLASLLSNQTYSVPQLFGPYYFIGQNYPFPDEGNIYHFLFVYCLIYSLSKLLYWHLLCFVMW